ncbi:hypothetical protein A1C_05275 [Rickettsia akari str. Hartford]|uniref:Uncharacterized protein n=1 Tax=Rickettsia akari (strain Hartford) TaxID=293614 RepID=A8GPI2_RICAH|nr:hypothetical protein A1C_05275 [Rickettsia akari str. Hartford]
MENKELDSLVYQAKLKDEWNK